MGRRRYRESQPGLIEEVADAAAGLVAALAGLIWRGVVRLFWPKTKPLVRAPRPARAAPAPSSASATIPDSWLEPELKPMPYRPVARLVTEGEYGVWYSLHRAVEGKYRLFCKVRLADVIHCPRGRRDERRWFKKIGNYHVDFVVCDPNTTAPLLVIELDDRGHRAPSRKKTDDFKDRVLRDAGMPIYRIRAQQAYDPAEIAAQIQRLVETVY